MAESTVEQWDLIVVGAGLAGMYTALMVAPVGKRILLLAKGDITASNTEQAQGGIAASISEQDSPIMHTEDTLRAGAGLCEPDAVRTLAEEGKDAIQSLIDLGVPFDLARDGSGLSLTREGAHSRRRILHASGDATGRVIRETLYGKLLKLGNVTIRPHSFAISLVMNSGQCQGVVILDDNNVPRTYLAGQVVLASGGACQMFQNTTNPVVATGDGIAMAWRAGAYLMDMEFVQFHPTALMLAGAPHFLISEAVRGEGALLLNVRGERFMPNYHADAELAPRDVVARAIVTEMERTGADHVLLDLSPLADRDVSRRFPTIYTRCQEYGLCLPQDKIPVAPAAHYFIGGIHTDHRGKTNIPGLFACGEATCTGIHGANRLASNSLLEALVYGQRIASQVLATDKAKTDDKLGSLDLKPSVSGIAELRSRLRSLVWRQGGLVRSRQGLEAALSELRSMSRQLPDGLYRDPQVMEVVNMLALAQMLIEGALLREESRGGHYRRDFPESSQNCLGHWLFARESAPRFVPSRDFEP